MKKLLVILLAMALVLALTACGGKTGNPEESSAEPQTSSEDSEFVEGDPAEYSQSYWEEKYPDYMFCPFYIDENGTEKSYYWPMGYEGLDGTISTWIECPFNWNGWHKTADGCIVNGDETLKITDDWANGEESMSSFCVVTTEKFEK